MVFVFVAGNSNNECYSRFCVAGRRNPRGDKTTKKPAGSKTTKKPGGGKSTKKPGGGGGDDDGGDDEGDGDDENAPSEGSDDGSSDNSSDYDDDEDEEGSKVLAFKVDSIRVEPWNLSLLLAISLPIHAFILHLMTSSFHRC